MLWARCVCSWMVTLLGFVIVFQMSVLVDYGSFVSIKRLDLFEAVVLVQALRVALPKVPKTGINLVESAA